MGLFHSSPADNHDERHNLGPHGPSLAPRTGRRLNWWEVLKLGAVTVSVGALQVTCFTTGDLSLSLMRSMMVIVHLLADFT